MSSGHVTAWLAVVHRLLVVRYWLQTTFTAALLVLVVVVMGSMPSLVRGTSMSALAAWVLFRRRPR